LKDGEKMAVERMAVRKRNQITLPKALIKALAIHEGDILEYTIESGRLIITPTTLIPKEQASCWNGECKGCTKEGLL
jgi:AbrB family looped-hinge helix DNA binding protein